MTPMAPRPNGAMRGIEELRRRAITLGFAVVSLLVFGLLGFLYWQLGHPILWAITLAVLFYPLHERFVTLLRGRERTAAVLSTLTAFLVIFVPAIFILANLIAEVRNLWPAVRDSLRPDAFEELASRLEASRFRALAHVLLSGDASAVTGGEPPVAGGAEVLEARLQEVALSVQEFLLERLRNVTRNIPGAVVSAAITIMAFFFFVLNGRRWGRVLRDALPLEPAHAERLVAIAAQTINVVFRGVVLTAGAQAAAAGAGYLVAGAPVPMLLTLATFVAALIPVVGSAAVWVPVAAGLLMAGHTAQAIGLAVYGTFFVSLLDNFLKPYLIGRGMKLPLLWLFLAILGGLKLFGFLGVILGPMLLSLALALARIYREGWREAQLERPFTVMRGEPEEPV